MTTLEAAAVTAVGRLAAPPVAAGGKSMGNWLKRKYGYVKHIDKNWKKLEKAKQSLVAKKLGVETELANNSSNKEKTEDCDRWLQQVANIIRQIDTVENDYGKRPSTCLCGPCPLVALHKLGKDIVEKTTEATWLTDELSRITTMRDRPASIPHRSRWINDVRIVDHPSLEKNVATVLEWLTKDKLKRICIWGPPGVGKTTIMKTVRQKMPESLKFDNIFFVTVAATAEIIQNEIWASLGKRMDENTNPRQRADEISKELRDKKYLLFLDEFSSEVYLEEVGIHSYHTQGKVVFACRDIYTGHTDEDLKVQGLSNEDAGKLFWKIVGSDLEKSGDIKGNAEKIIELCGGMPSMIILLGKELKQENDPARWRHTKKQLQSSMEPWQELEEYYRSFRLVYDRLDDTHKNCLLYWAIFPLGEEINRDYMIDCWIAEQFLKEERLHATRDEGHSVLADFVRKLLVQKGEKLGHFKMFECFQKAAFRIANIQNDRNIFVANGTTMQKEEWKQAKRVSLARVRLSPLPEMPRCGGMLTLFFQENSLKEFPAQFFKFMTDLQVLGLKETGVTALPSSISELINLQGLFLNNGSQFVHLPRKIGKLRNLKILDVTGIYSLPSQIGQLKSLKCLRVSFKDAGNQNHVREEKRILCFGNCSSSGENEQMIPGGTIEKLSNLEELSLDVSRSISRWNKNANEIANEITMLEQLTHLHFYFADLKSFQNFIEKSRSWNADDRIRDFVGFRSFSFFVGQQGDSSASGFNIFECSAEKHLKFSVGDGFPEAVSEVLKQAKSFELIGHTTASNLNNLPADALQELEACIVKGCGEMLSIVSGHADTTGVTDSLPAATFQDPGCSEAQSTVNGNSKVATGGLTNNLSADTLQDPGCSEARSTVNGNSKSATRGVIDSFCSEVQSTVNGNSKATGVTNNLSTATFQDPERNEVQSTVNGNSKATEVTDNLPAATSQEPECGEAQSIVNGYTHTTGGVTDNLTAASSQEQEDRIVEERNDAMRSITNGNSKATGVTNNLTIAALQEQEDCIVEECDAMQSITNGNSKPTGGVTDNLRAATSQEANESIIPQRDAAMQGNINGNSRTTGVVFRCLEKLNIENLPKLEHIWRGNIAFESFRVLKTLTLKECPVITALFSLEMVRQLPKLKHLQVEDCTGIEQIIEAESTVRSTALPELKSFQFRNLTSLSSICYASLEWPSLETILIKTCGELKRLPHILVNAPELTEIRCAEDWWNQQAWPEPETKERFRTLRRDFS